MIAIWLKEDGREPFDSYFVREESRYLSTEWMTAPPIGYKSVLNGSAYDAKHDSLFITGKQWLTVLEIEIGSRTPEKCGFRVRIPAYPARKLLWARPDGSKA